MAEGGAPGGKDIKQQEDDKDKPQEEEESSAQPSNQSTSEWLMSMMKRSLGLADQKDYPEQLLQECTFQAVVDYIKSGKCKNIITMAGAGISTSAGIPDFRSPGTGLYHNLEKYNLPSPQAIFEIGFFRENPEPFFQLARELYPGIFKPTPCHYFVRMLHEKGMLLRHYTQNIDTLEHVASVPAEKIVEAHGTFHTAHCLECRTEYSQDWVKEKIFADVVPKCAEDECDGLVKPDIVFFGEALPAKFFKCAEEDLPKCDLLIVMGTSLVVQPFASLVNRVKDTAPRLYINLEKGQGSSDPIMALLGMGHGFRFDCDDNYRDVFWEGTCDDGCLALAEKLGWTDELKKVLEEEHARIDKENAAGKPKAKAASAKAEPKAAIKKEAWASPGADEAGKKEGTSPGKKTTPDTLPKDRSNETTKTEAKSEEKPSPL